MEPHEELMTFIRGLKAARRTKLKEEKKEEAHLENLKIRLRTKLDHDRKAPNSRPIAETA